MRMLALNMGSKSLHENCETILARIAKQSIDKAQGIVVVCKAHYEVTER